MATGVIYALNGLNRGGRTNATELLKKPKMLANLGRVDLIDPEPGRAEAMAREFERVGVNAVPYECSALETLGFEANIRNMAIDDTGVLSRIMGNGSKQDVLQGSILLTSGHPGYHDGAVVGFGGSLCQGDTEAKGLAKTMFDQVDQLTGPERVTSRFMQSRPVEMSQLANTRDISHRFLVDEMSRFLDGEKVSSKVFATETINPDSPCIYPATLIPCDDEKGKKKVLRDVAMDVAKASEHDAVAVVFYQPGKPWMYTTFLVKRAKHWNFQPIDIELPVPQETIDIYRKADERRAQKIADAEREAARIAAASASDYDYAYATD